jgi:hypothetical protein
MMFFNFFDGRSLVFQVIHLLLLLAWLGLSIAALLGLRKNRMNEIARVLWVALIVAVPILGAVAYWIVRPEEEQGGVG